MPEGQLDRVIHNYGTSDEYSLEGNIVGINGPIQVVQDTHALELILGTSNLDNINKVSQLVNKTPMHLWRLNSKPSEKTERIVRFIAYSDGLNLDCLGNPLNGNPAFRVLKVE